MKGTGKFITGFISAGALAMSATLLKETSISNPSVIIFGIVGILIAVIGLAMDTE